MSDAFFELLSRVHEQKQYALVKELHGERIGMGAKVVSIRRWTGDRG